MAAMFPMLKSRRVKGEPVPANVLAEMKRLEAIFLLQRWAESEAASLNRLFLEQGATGEMGCITSETVQHHERRKGKMGTL